MEGLESEFAAAGGNELPQRVHLMIPHAFPPNGLRGTAAFACDRDGTRGVQPAMRQRTLDSTKVTCPDCKEILAEAVKKIAAGERYDSTADTLHHSRRVGELISTLVKALVDRSLTHDLSKLRDPELAAFNQYTPVLRTLTYGTPEYRNCLAQMQPALEHHYANNRHHPEHGETGLQWRPVVGYEDHYEVSNFGDIRSVDRVIPRERQGAYIKAGQVLRAQVTAKGYLRVALAGYGVQRNHLVHRMVAEAFLPNPDGRPEVNHENGDKTDNRVDNLSWATTSENLVHAYNNGLRESSVKYVVHCPELDLTTFGTQAMEHAVRERGYPGVTASGIWAVMDRGGRHFDLTFEGTQLREYRRSRLNGMTLVDLVEMLADWKAATERVRDGDLRRSLTINADRFGISDQLLQALTNTAEEFGWL